MRYFWSIDEPLQPEYRIKKPPGTGQKPAKTLSQRRVDARRHPQTDGQKTRPKGLGFKKAPTKGLR